MGGISCSIAIRSVDGGLGLQTLRDKHEDAVTCGRMCYLYNVTSASGSLGPSII